MNEQSVKDECAAFLEAMEESIQAFIRQLFKEDRSRKVLADRIQIKSLDIHDTLMEANRISNVTRKFERF